MIKVTNATGTLRETIEIDEDDIASMKQNGPFSYADSRGHRSESYTTTIRQKSGGKVVVEGTEADIEAKIKAAKGEGAANS